MTNTASTALRHLVWVEHAQQTIAPSTLRAIAAARAISAPIDLIVLGAAVAPVVEQAQKIDGIDTVWYCDAPQLKDELAENLVPLIAAKMNAYSHFWCAATTSGRNLAPRLAGTLNVGMVSGIVAVLGANQYTRTTYAGSVYADLQHLDQPQIISVNTTSFDATLTATGAASAVALDGAPTVSDSIQLLHQGVTVSDRPDLSSASIVVSGGRGVGSKENFELIEALADTLSAAVGASRAAVDAGYIANDHQVGQTGKNVAPDWYFAIGISGAVQHLAGMKGAKKIVAINKDPDAPMMQIADYVLVGDLFTIVPALTQALQQR